MRLESETGQAGGLVVCQGAGGTDLGRSQGSAAPAEEKHSLLLSDLYGLADGKGANQILHAATVGTGRRGGSEQEEEGQD